MKKTIQFIIMAFFSLSLLAKEEAIKLVVSAATLTEFDPFGLFYGSAIFRGHHNPPFLIADGAPVVFESDDAVFYSSDAISEADIIAATSQQEAVQVFGLSGSSYQAFVMKGQAPVAMERYLGAERDGFASQKRVVNQKNIVAFSKEPQRKSVAWPKREAELRRVPAVLLSDEQGSFVALVRARAVGDSAHRLGLIDMLVAKNNNKAVLIDLGSNHGHKKLSPEAMNAFLRRNPKVLFPGTSEMASLMQSSWATTVPTIYPMAGHQHGVIKSDDRVINVWAAQGSEKLWPLFGKLGQPIGLDAMIAEMGKDQTDPDKVLNVVRVFSEEAAKEAARSVYVDVVLLLAHDPFMQLASKEVIELKKAKTDAYEQIAPIVRVSYLDVSEIELLGPRNHAVQRVVINRYPISEESPKAKDIEGKTALSFGPGLPARDGNKLWRTEDIEKVLGGIMVSSTGADVALFEAKSIITPIQGTMTADIAKNLLDPHSTTAVISISGKQLKKINRDISRNVFQKKISVYGMDTKTMRIGDRALNDNERFSVVVTEPVLLELFGLSMLGGLGEDYSIRAPFVEAIYGDLQSIYFIAGPKVIPISDTQEHIADAVKGLRHGPSLDEVIAVWLAPEQPTAAQTMLEDAKGKPHHVITFDLSYVDLGISKNLTNDNYDAFAEGKALPMGRGNVPAFTHIFLFVKGALTHDAPFLISTLSGELKYLHTNMKEKPEKDKTKIGLKMRLPLERGMFKESSIIASPLIKSTYETKLLPNFWASHSKIPKRTSRFDSLLGVNFDFTKLGFNMDVGGVMANDLNRFNVYDATDFGPGVNFFSKWSLFGPVELSSDINSYYLFAVPNNTIKDKLAMGIEGTVWLRLARFYDFSIAAVSDFLVANLQNDHKKFAISSIFGLTFSYGRMFRLFG